MTTDSISPAGPEPIAQDANRFPAGHPADVNLQRRLSDIYAFWSLCDVSACRRAGRCTGDASRCCNTCMPLISDAVYMGGQRLFEARRDGLSFETAMKRWPDELSSLWTWRFRIENRRGAPRPRARVSGGRSRA